MDMCAPLRRPLIICYFLWVSVWVCTCVQACVLLRVCDRDIPAAETWEGVTYETLDSALSGDWGVLKCQNSNFLQTVTHTLTLCISLTQPNPLCCHHSYLPELSLPSHLSFIYKHCLSFSLSSILMVPQGEILSHTTVPCCHPTSSYLLPSSN